MVNEYLDKYFPELARHLSLKEEIVREGKLQTLEKGTTLVREGEFVKYIPLVVSGSVKVCKENSEGGEYLLYYINAGESCIMSAISCTKQQKSSIKAISEETTEILLIPAGSATKFGQKYSIWNEYFFGLFKLKYHELLDIINILTFSRKDVRLLQYLEQRSERKSDNTIYDTHQNIANDLGSSREVTSRLLKKLEKEGKLHLGHGKITLTKTK